MNNDNYWLWLQKALGVSARIDDIVSYFETAQNIYEAGDMEWRLSGVFTPKQIDKLQSTKIDSTWQEIDVCQKNGIKIITPENEDYPSLLKNIPDYPAVLYTLGDLSVVNDTICIAMVGTRKASKNSVEVAHKLSSSMANAGATIISGGALGIDTASHEGALSSGGKTVAVLGCGLLYRYLMENAPLRKEIAKTGAVVSEFSPLHAPDRRTFPIRNRLISGMSLGTVVIEAGERSGSLITASLALDQGRDVFAVPGNIISSAYNGANKLIRDGAKPVFEAIDVLEEYSYMYPHKLNLCNAVEPSVDDETYLDVVRKSNFRKEIVEDITKDKPQEEKVVKKRKLRHHVTPNAENVYNLFNDKPLHIDELVLQSGLSVSALLSAVTELELYGYITLIQGKKYTIK